MKSEAQINDAIKKINSNSELLYGYKEDLISFYSLVREKSKRNLKVVELEWTLGKGEIDRL